MTRNIKVDINTLLEAFELYEQGKGKPQFIMTEDEMKDVEIKALKERNKYLEIENEVLKKRREFEREMMN